MSGFKSLFLCAAVCLGAAGAQATGMVAGATEPTQIMNNLELIKVAADGAVTAKKTVEQYATQLQQFHLEQLNIRSLAGLPAGLAPDSLKAVNDLIGFKQALTKLEGSLGQQEQAIERRMTEARLSGKNWQGYLADVAADAARKQTRAVERLKYEEQVIQQVHSDYAFARNLQTQIPATVGQHQSLQMLNGQMNRVITQNAKLLEVVSATVRKQAEQDAEGAEAMTRNAADREILRQRQSAIETRQRAFGGLPQQ
jgi:conjugal transfer/entry exclusion protein